MSRKLLVNNVDAIKGNDVLVLVENHSLNGESYIIDNIDIDFNNGDYVEVSIELPNIPIGTENILSIGEEIDKWGVGRTVVHFYYNTGKKIIIDVMTKGHQKSLGSFNYTNANVILKLSKEGIFVNGSITELVANGHGFYNTFLSELLNLTLIQVGSVEGKIRSYATYNYIKIVKGNSLNVC